MGELVTHSGDTLPITTWNKTEDSLTLVLIPNVSNPEDKWIFQGAGRDSLLWTGVVSQGALGRTTRFDAKTPKCEDIQQPNQPPPPRTPVDTLIRIPTDSDTAVACMELSFTFDDGCQADGMAKLSYDLGEIPIGNLFLANTEAGDFHSVTGNVFGDSIKILATRIRESDKSRDSLFVQGIVDGSRSSAKGVFQHVRSSRGGNWTSRARACGAWTPNPNLTPCLSE
jgi:hypothetical protein